MEPSQGMFEELEPLPIGSWAAAECERREWELIDAHQPVCSTEIYVLYSLFLEQADFKNM